MKKADAEEAPAMKSMKADEGRIPEAGMAVIASSVDSGSADMKVGDDHNICLSRSQNSAPTLHCFLLVPMALWYPSHRAW